MTPDSYNYGVYRPHEPYDPYRRPPRYLASREDRVWAVAAHLSTFVNLFTGFLGPVVALVIWLAKRNDSPMVASHARRSVVYQTCWLLAIAAGWAVTIALTHIFIGFLLWPLMLLVSIAPFVHASIAAVGAWNDRRIHL